jgi:hypothetical protein
MEARRGEEKSVLTNHPCICTQWISSKTMHIYRHIVLLLTRKHKHRYKHMNTYIDSNMYELTHTQEFERLCSHSSLLHPETIPFPGGRPCSEELGILKLRIVEARNLPAMDLAKGYAHHTYQMSSASLLIPLHAPPLPWVRCGPCLLYSARQCTCTGQIVCVWNRFYNIHTCMYIYIYTHTHIIDAHT